MRLSGVPDYKSLAFSFNQASLLVIEIIPFERDIHCTQTSLDHLDLIFDIHEMLLEASLFFLSLNLSFSENVRGEKMSPHPPYNTVFMPKIFIFTEAFTLFLTVLRSSDKIRVVTVDFLPKLAIKNGIEFCHQPIGDIKISPATTLYVIVQYLKTKKGGY